MIVQLLYFDFQNLIQQTASILDMFNLNLIVWLLTHFLDSTVVLVEFRIRIRSEFLCFIYIDILYIHEEMFDLLAWAKH